MYSVVRFRDPTGTRDLPRWGDALNAVRPGMFDGLDCVPNRFSCTVGDGDCWQLHRDAICGFLEQSAPFLSSAIDAGLEIEFDVAIHPDDLTRFLTELTLDPHVLFLLNARKVCITLSVYNPDGLLRGTSAHDPDTTDRVDEPV